MKTKSSDLLHFEQNLQYGTLSSQTNQVLRQNLMNMKNQSNLIKFQINKCSEKVDTTEPQQPPSETVNDTLVMVRGTKKSSQAINTPQSGFIPYKQDSKSPSPFKFAIPRESMKQQQPLPQFKIVRNNPDNNKQPQPVQRRPARPESGGGCANAHRQSWQSSLQSTPTYMQDRFFSAEQNVSSQQEKGNIANTNVAAQQQEIAETGKQTKYLSSSRSIQMWHQIDRRRQNHQIGQKRTTLMSQKKLSTYQHHATGGSHPRFGVTQPQIRQSMQSGIDGTH